MPYAFYGPTNYYFNVPIFSSTSEVLHSEIRQKDSARGIGARWKMHTKIRRVCSEKAHFAENIFRMHFLVEER